MTTSESGVSRKLGGAILACGIAVMIGGAALLFRGGSTSAPQSADEGAPAPAFTLSDLSGQQSSLSDYKGKVVLLDFWATWCDACKEEMPDLKLMYASLHPKGLEFLAPSMDEDGKKALLPFVAQYEIPWKVLLANEETARAYGIFGLPTKFLIDRKGMIAHKYVGTVEPAELERDVKSLLQKENTAS